MIQLDDNPDPTLMMIREFKPYIDKLMELKMQRDNNFQKLDALEQRRLELIIEKLELEIRKLKDS